MARVRAECFKRAVELHLANQKGLIIGEAYSAGLDGVREYGLKNGLPNHELGEAMRQAYADSLRGLYK
jgi:hypothetical protein